jgi:hypothetical protein
MSLMLGFNILFVGHFREVIGAANARDVVLHGEESGLRFGRDIVVSAWKDDS